MDIRVSRSYKGCTMNYFKRSLCTSKIFPLNTILFFVSIIEAIHLRQIKIKTNIMKVYFRTKNNMPTNNF